MYFFDKHFKKYPEYPLLCTKVAKVRYKYILHERLNLTFQ
jgi:hypothetical protein